MLLEAWEMDLMARDPYFNLPERIAGSCRLDYDNPKLALLRQWAAMKIQTLQLKNRRFVRSTIVY